ncbi:MAG TPA: hypothetical protein VK252_01495 [Solirubrobacteraceae bacterium]|nr:hypothetical protein [Solirubrobacteraceae bacterium]
MLGLALSAVTWLQPPPVLPVPSRTGEEGPPRSFGVQPPLGTAPPPTNPQLVRLQNHALLDGPFPRGGLLRGISTVRCCSTTTRKHARWH